MSSKKSDAHFPRRGEVWQVDFNPSLGAEIKKKRPAVIVSNNQMNSHAKTLLVMPITSGSFSYFFRIRLSSPEGGVKKSSHIVTEQITTVDKSRLGKRLGKLKSITINKLNVSIIDHLGLPESMILP